MPSVLTHAYYEGIDQSWKQLPPAQKRKVAVGLKQKVEEEYGEPWEVTHAELLDTLQGGSRKKRIQAFLDRYFYAPDLFAKECIRWPQGRQLHDHQADALQRLIQHRRHSTRGPRGLGKTALGAISVHWWALTRSLAGLDWKLPTLANYWRQLERFLWPEVHKWAGLLRWHQVIPRQPYVPKVELQTLSLKLRGGEAFALSTNDADSIEGAHANHLYVLFDESKIIDKSIWDSMEGAFSDAWGPNGNQAYWMANSIAGETSGEFYDIHRKAKGTQQWDTNHVTAEEVVACGQITQEWIDNRRERWGAESMMFKNHCLGEFAENTSDTLIPLSWIEAAQERWYEREEERRMHPIVQVGADIGRGGDKSVLAPRTKRTVTELIRTNIANTMDTAGRTSGQLKKHPEARAMIDLTGLGAGVYDRVAEDYPDRTGAFVASGKTDFQDRSGEIGFPNKRCAALWNLRELLDPQYEEYIALPPDENIAAELTSYRYRYISGAKVQVESKRTAFGEGEETLVQRLGYSPDDSDAIVMAFWEEREGELGSW